MNRRLILALALASAFAVQTSGAYAEDDEKQPKRPEQPQLSVADDKLIAQSDPQEPKQPKPEPDLAA